MEVTCLTLVLKKKKISEKLIDSDELIPLCFRSKLSKFFMCYWWKKFRSFTCVNTELPQSENTTFDSQAL